MERWTKLLAWCALGAALVFALVALVPVVAPEALGTTGIHLFWYLGLPLLVLSTLLAVTLLVVSAFQS